MRPSFPTLKACLSLPDRQPDQQPAQAASSFGGSVPLAPHPHPHSGQKWWPLSEFLESFVSGMLGILITGCLCILIIQTLFPLKDCKLLEGRSFWGLRTVGWLPSPSPHDSQYLSEDHVIFTSH